MKKTHLLYQCIVLVLSLTVLSGCEESENLPSGGTTPQCSKPFDKVVLSAEVKNQKDIYFRLDDFSFLDTPGLQIETVILDVVIKGKYTRDHSLAFNGFKAGRRDGDSTSDKLVYDPKTDQTYGQYKLHKFYLNGALLFANFLSKIRKDKGELKLSLNGKHLKIISATISVHGKIHEKCSQPTPTPTPSPQPVPPTTVINSVTPNTSPTGSTTITFDFTSSSSTNQTMCSLNGSSPALCRSPQSYSQLTTGSQLFKVYSVSAQGLSDVNPPTYTWVIDATAPVVSIDNLAQLKTLSNVDSISFQFSSTEAGTFYCKLDALPEEVCTTPKAYQSLSEGGHAFEVSVVDQVGNRSLPARFAWTIDMTAPVTTLVSVVPSANITNSTSKTFEFAANESATFECSVDNQTFSSCSSPISLVGFQEGNHWFEVRATDGAGNVGLPVSYSWRVDTTIPVIATGAIVPAPGATNARTISVDFSVSEPSEVECTFDGVAQVCTSPFTVTITTEGAHSLSLKATDLAGNVSGEILLNWMMDFSSPQISFGPIRPSAAQYINVAKLEAEIISNETSRYTSFLDGVNLQQNSSPIVLFGLTEGSHELQVQGYDSVGNLSNLLTHQFIVDTIAPAISLTVRDSTTPTRFDTRSFDFVANETATYLCQFDGSGFSLCTSPHDLSGIADGDHSFTVRAIDLAGNVSQDSTHNWTVDTTAPTTTVIVDQQNHNISFSLNSSETPATFLCSLDGAAFQTCTTPARYSNVAVGAHTFTVRAQDEAGNVDIVGATHSFTVVDPITTNITSVAISMAITSINTNTFAFTASQAAATFQCSIDNQAPSACTSPIQYFGLSDGAHMFHVQAIDRFGNIDPVGASYGWTIDTLVPTITSQSISVTSTSVTVSWTTDEAATSRVFWGRDPAFDRDTGETSSYVTSHSVRLSGLTRNTAYTVQVTGRDRAGNVYLGPRRATRTSN